LPEFFVATAVYEISGQSLDRGRFMKTGSIEVSGRTIACLIRNESESGAALEVVSPVGIPAQFTLLIAAERIRCTAIWRTKTLIGVKFHRV
jgi:hypothetical protein